MQTVGRCGGSVVIHDLWLDRHQDLPECPVQKNGDKWQLVRSGDKFSLGLHNSRLAARGSLP